MIEIYDNGGDTLDRYTIFLDDSDDCIGASETGSGYYQHDTGTRGEHLGNQIDISDLSPELVARLRDEVRQTAIDWQTSLQDGDDLSYGELLGWQSYFESVAEPLDLLDEFKENGII